MQVKGNDIGYRWGKIGGLIAHFRGSFFLLFITQYDNLIVYGKSKRASRCA